MDTAQPGVLKCGCTGKTIATRALSPIGADMMSATSLSLSIYYLLLYGTNCTGHDAHSMVDFAIFCKKRFIQKLSSVLVSRFFLEINFMYQLLNLLFVAVETVWQGPQWIYRGRWAQGNIWQLYNTIYILLLILWVIKGTLAWYFRRWAFFHASIVPRAIGP